MSINKGNASILKVQTDVVVELRLGALKWFLLELLRGPMKDLLFLKGLEYLLNILVLRDCHVKE